MGIGLAIFAIMRTWRWGRKATFAAYTAKHTMTMRRLVEFHRSEKAYMERIGLLMTPKHLSSLNDNAPALLQLLHDRYGILPRHLIFVQVAHRKVPYIHDGRYDITVFHKDENSSIIAVTLQFGFMEEPNVEAVLEDMARHQEIDLPIDQHRWIVHVSVEHLLPSRNMTPWGRVRLGLFRIPPPDIAARPLFLWARRQRAVVGRNYTRPFKVTNNLPREPAPFSILHCTSKFSKVGRLKPFPFLSRWAATKPRITRFRTTKNP